MVTKISQGGHTAYGLQEFVIDKAADVDYLPITVQPGSTAFCIETSTAYMLNSDGEWKEI